MFISTLLMFAVGLYFLELIAAGLGLWIPCAYYLEPMVLVKRILRQILGHI